jgi:hypothetical protein
MPFSIIRSNSRERFGEVFVHLAFIEGQESHDESSKEVKILRGLFYVHLYSALEKVINETVEQVILIVKSENIKNKHYENSFNVISLNSKMQGFKTCSSKNYFSKSAEVFESLDSNDNFDLNNTLFSENLQNVWSKTIHEIIRCFGAPPIVIEPRIKLTIDEVVDKRNAVAHGRETPIAVGERHRSNILRSKTQEIQQVVEQFISAFELFVQNKSYINPIYLHEYLAI